MGSTETENKIAGTEGDGDAGAGQARDRRCGWAQSGGAGWWSDAGSLRNDVAAVWMARERRSGVKEARAWENGGGRGPRDDAGGKD
ncbi:hypothetical protein M0R45_035705 [Rubus argutus]|uniref:Uncharacterized protein n=1 Tax=Rubus argutus TaxID=59490 RepID=A0AAW1VXN9_RUBAR